MESRKQDPEKRGPAQTAAAPSAIADRPIAPLSATTPTVQASEPASRGPAIEADLSEPVVVVDDAPEESVADLRPIVLDPDLYWSFFE